MKQFLVFVALITLVSCFENNTNDREEKPRTQERKIYPDVRKSASTPAIDTVSISVKRHPFKKPYNVLSSADTINAYTLKANETIQVFTKTDTLILESQPDLEESKVIYEYQGFNANNLFHIIGARYWEHHNCILIDHHSDRFYTLWENVVFSPNDSSLVTKSPNYGLEGDPNGFQVWQLNKSREWVKSYEINQTKWIPVSIDWASKDTFQVKAVSLAHFEEKKGIYDSLSDFRVLAFGVEDSFEK